MEHNITLNVSSVIPKKEEYVFHIPKQHIDNLVNIRYPSSSLQRTIIQEECAELIQVVSKYSRWVEEPYHSDKTSIEIRNQIAEELTHVAICLGMLQYYFGIRQDEIDAEVKRKALKEHFDLSKYPSHFQDNVQ